MSKIQTASVALLVLMVFFVTIQARPVKKMPVTGDEPTYLLMGLSFFEDMDLDIRNNFENGGHRRIGLANFETVDAFHHEGKYPGHSGVISIMASPIIGMYGVTGARFFSLLFAVITVLLLYHYLSLQTAPPLAAAVSACLMFTVPFLNYASVFYTEAIASFFILLGFYLLKKEMTPVNAFLFLLTICFYPFLHLRLVPVTASMFLIYLWTVWGQKRSVSVKFLIPFSLALIFGTFFLIIQVYAYGGLTGSASGSFGGMSLINFINRASIQLFWFRGGLLPYSPFWLLAFIAIIDGCIRKERDAVYAVLILMPYLFVITFGNSGESTPGRFWSALTPIMIIPLSIALNRPISKWLYILGVPLIAFSLLDSYFYIKNSDLYLNNIGFSKLYTGIFYEKFHLMDLGMIFPADFEPVSYKLGIKLLLSSLLFIIFQVIAIRDRMPVIIRNISGSLSALTVLVVLSSALLFPVSDYTVTSNHPENLSALADKDTSTTWTTGTARKNGDYLQIDFKEPTAIRVIHLIGDHNELPARYLIEVSSDGKIFNDISDKILNARRYVMLPESRRIRSIKMINIEDSNTAWSIREQRIENTLF